MRFTTALIPFFLIAGLLCWVNWENDKNVAPSDTAPGLTELMDQAAVDGSFFQGDPVDDLAAPVALNLEPFFCMRDLYHGGEYSVTTPPPYTNESGPISGPKDGGEEWTGPGGCATCHEGPTPHGGGQPRVGGPGVVYPVFVFRSELYPPNVGSGQCEIQGFTTPGVGFGFSGAAAVLVGAPDPNGCCHVIYDIEFSSAVNNGEFEVTRAVPNVPPVMGPTTNFPDAPRNRGDSIRIGIAPNCGETLFVTYNNGGQEAFTLEVTCATTPCANYGDPINP